MRNQVKSSTTAKNSNRSAQKITLNDVLVGVGFISMLITASGCDANSVEGTLVGFALSFALIYLGKGFDFQNKSNR